MTPSAPPSEAADGAAGTLFVEEQRFAIVPEWVIDAPISDGAFRLYSLLLRYGNSTGCRMPSRLTLAPRLRRSVDAVDRSMRQLTEAGIVRVEHRRSGEQFLSNRYHVRTTAPAHTPTIDGGGRISAATPESPETGSRSSAATPGRTSAARVAADVRPNPEILTDKAPPPPPSRVGRSSAPKAVEEAGDALLASCGITNLDGLAQRCIAARRVSRQHPSQRRATSPSTTGSSRRSVNSRQTQHTRNVATPLRSPRQIYQKGTTRLNFRAVIKIVTI